MFPAKPRQPLGRGRPRGLYVHLSRRPFLTLDTEDLRATGKVMAVRAEDTVP